MASMEPPEHRAGNLYTVWFKDCKTQAERKTRRDEIQAAKRGFEILSQLIKSKDKAAQLKRNDYTSPSWAYLMADTIGYQRALEEITKLLDNTTDIDPTIKE